MVGVKQQVRAADWADVGVREASLIQRCAAGDEMAFAELVAEHQRMVVQLAMNLLGDRDEDTAPGAPGRDRTDRLRNGTPRFFH